MHVGRGWLSGGGKTGMVGSGVDATRRGDDFASTAHATESTTDGIVAVIDVFDDFGDGHGARAGQQAGKDGLTDRRESSRDSGQGVGPLAWRPTQVGGQPAKDRQAWGIETSEIVCRHLGSVRSIRSGRRGKG